MSKIFTNEECQVIVKALDGLSRSVEILSKHIYDSYDEETFAHIVKPYKDCIDFVRVTRHHLDEIQKRLQS